MKKIIIIAAGAFVLVGASVGATVFILGGDENSDVAEATADADSEEDAAPAEPVIKPDPFYLEMRPPFVMSLKAKGRSRFLQVEAALVTHDKGKFEALENHLPAIKAKLVAVFSDQELTELQKPGAREKLREEALIAVQETMTEAHGEPAAENIYFTRFIIQ